MASNPTMKFAEMRGAPPEDAAFFWNGGPVEMAERTWFSSMLSGATAFDTDEGIVLVDAGTAILAPHIAGEIREKTQSPIHTAIFTHGHVDHAYGLPSFLLEGQDAPRVIAHSAMPARFARYDATSEHNAAINARQFGGAVDRQQGVDFSFPEILPDTLYDDDLTIEVGGVTFELFHARGETDDHTWIYCPDRGVLCPGDLIIWGVPNAGNPQKVQRYPWDWAAALRAMAEKEPRSLAPGHGGPVVDDPAKVRAILTETAELLETIVDRTLTLLNDGSPPHVDIVTGIDLPVSASPWLQPVYDETEFIVRNVIRYYGGWFTGRPSELKPAPRDALAATLADLAGGPTALLDRAETLAAGGDLRQACHLADFALEAAPNDGTVQERVVAIYEQRADGETGLMSINIFNSAAAYARDGRPFR
jgi:glyoxylase-like metal-dependent hydrolase (beta-lactamase superfamily II)